MMDRSLDTKFVLRVDTACIYLDTIPLEPYFLSS